MSFLNKLFIKQNQFINRLIKCEDYLLNVGVNKLKFRKYSSRIAPPPTGMDHIPLPNDLLENVCGEASSKGLVIGIYADPEDQTDTGVLTPTGWKFNKDFTNGKLMNLMKISGPVPKCGEVRLLFGSEIKDPKFSVVAVAGLGRECLGYNSYEMIDEGKEAIRTASAAGVMALQDLKTAKIEVESFGHAESAAEGANLGMWLYQELKQKKNRKFMPQMDLFAHREADCDLDGWRIGMIKAGAQNLVRQLQETPSNLLTPTTFAQTAVEVLCKSGVNVEVKVSGWAESQQMNSFLAIARASCETPIFLELSYYGAGPEERPIVLVGQGVTYDSGGLCVKDPIDLLNKRAGMTGAAVVVATCRAIAALQLPLNIRGLIPLCENVLGCNAFKPGDCYRAMNGKSVEFGTTGNNDLLVLIDALLYAQNFCPRFIVDIGTCTKVTSETLGEAACPVFTNSEILWQQIKNASVHTGCRVWRFPLWRFYNDQVCSYPNADVCNEGDIEGELCKQAALLSEFVPCGQWMHIDVTNLMSTDGTALNYLRKGMSGRPTRTIIEFLARIVCYDNEPKII